METKTKACTFSELGIENALFSPDHEWLATLVSGEDASGIRNATLTLRRADAAEPVHRLSMTPITQWAFSPDSGLLALGMASGEIRLISVSQGQMAASLTRHAVSVTALAFDPVANRMASADSNGRLLLWDLASSGTARTVQDAGPAVRALAFSPDGTQLAAGGEDAVTLLFSLASQPPGFVLTKTLRGHSSSVEHVVFGETEPVLYTVSVDEIKVWNPASREPQETPAAPKDHGGALSAAMIPNTGTLLTAHRDGAVLRWNVDSGAYQDLLWRPSGEDATEAWNPLISPGSRWVLLRGGRSLVLRDLSANQERLRRDGSDFTAARAAFSPDDTHLAVFRADPAMDTALLEIYALETSNPPVEIELHTSGSGWPWAFSALGFTPDGSQVVLGGENRVLMYQVADGKPAGTISVASFSPSAQNMCCFSPGGSHLAYTGEGNDLVLVDAKDGTEGVRFSGHSAPVTALCFSTGGRRLVSASADSTLRMWDISNGQELANFGALVQQVSGVRFDRFRTTLVVTGEDPPVTLYRAFPWSSGYLPADPAVPLDERIEALKMYSPWLAPPWGQCQAAMFDLQCCQLEQIRCQEEAGAPPEDPDCPPYTCPGGGFYLPASGSEPPQCSLHGPLGNLHYVLWLAGQLEILAGTGETKTYDLVRQHLFRQMPEVGSAFTTVVKSWIGRGGGHARAAKAGCEYWLARYSMDGEVGTLEARAALELGDYEEAIGAFRSGGTEYDAFEESLPSALAASEALALVRRGLEQDLIRAGDLLENYLSWRSPSADSEEALDLLEKTPGYDPERLARLKRLRHYPADAWREVPWEHDLPAALKTSSRSGRPVFLEISTPYAYDNPKLREIYYSHPYVLERLPKYYVLCAVDAIQNPAVAREYGVTHFPELLVLDGEGNVLVREPPADKIMDFRSCFLKMNRNRNVLRDWRVIGPFEYRGDDWFDTPYVPETEPDCSAVYPGKTGDAVWQACSLPSIRSTFIIDDYFPGNENSVFYAWTRFHLSEPQEVRLRAHFVDMGRVWLDGEVLTKYSRREKGTHVCERPMTLTAGDHDLLVKLVYLSHCELRFSVRGPEGEAIPGLQPVSMPDCPRMYLPKQPPSRVTGETAAVIAAPDVTRAKVNKDMLLREWRQNYAQILAQINPRPYFQNGKPAGIQGDNLSNIPLISKLGVRDGDILISVNGYGLGEGKTVLEIAEITSGSKTYTIDFLRNGKIIRFIVDVED